MNQGDKKKQTISLILRTNFQNLPIGDTTLLLGNVTDFVATAEGSPKIYSNGNFQQLENFASFYRSADRRRVSRLVEIQA